MRSRIHPNDGRSDAHARATRARDEPLEAGRDRPSLPSVRPTPLQREPSSPRRKNARRGSSLDQAGEASIEECVEAASSLIEDTRKQGAFVRMGAPSRAKQPSTANNPAAPVELIVLACKTNALRCRVLGTERELTLRTGVRDEVPGEIVSVIATKQWTYARNVYLSGEVQSSRSDVEALDLTPLALHDQGEWSPDEEYWGEEGELIDPWARPIIARGKRPMFELEQVMPGVDPEDFESDPILEASELAAAGDHRKARALLMGLLARDLRCLDAHAHLGNLEFDHWPRHAVRHYAMGMKIGVLSLGKKFDGVLPWGLIDNRPFLRCMFGLGLCWWKLGQMREAAAVFRRMLWLNPGDNQGARFNLAAIEDGRAWNEMEEP